VEHPALPLSKSREVRQSLVQNQCAGSKVVADIRAQSAKGVEHFSVEFTRRKIDAKLLASKAFTQKRGKTKSRGASSIEHGNMLMDTHLDTGVEVDLVRRLHGRFPRNSGSGARPDAFATSLFQHLKKA
jgi:hypothetical protein